MTPDIRESTADDADDIVYLLDAAMLDFDRERVRRRVGEGDVLVAVDTAGEVVGACVLCVVDDGAVEGDGDVIAAADIGGSEAKPTEIESIAVRRSRRGHGIGRALVDAAAARAAVPLVARFREQVRPFYAALGFEIRRVGGAKQEGDGDAGPDAGDRLCGILK